MNGTWAATRAEWLRLARPKRLLALPVTAALAALYASGLGVAAENGVLGAHSGFWLAAAASSGLALSLALVGALLAASGLSGDLAGGVARAALSSPLSRAEWVAGRVLVLSAGTCSLFVAAELGTLAAAAARFGLHGATEGEYEIASPALLAGQLAAACALVALALCAAVALGALIGVLLARVGPAAVAVVLSGAALTALSRWPRLDPFLPLSPLTQAFDRVAQLGQGLAGPRATDGAWTSALVCVAWMLAAAALAGAALSRKDVLS